MDNYSVHACTPHGACSNCKYGPNGCSWSSFSNSYSCNCAGSTLYCDRGSCGTCTPPGCPTHYTTTNTGCSNTTSTSCPRQDCAGTCGYTYRTCYRVKYTVTYNANGGSCTLSSRTVCYNDTSSGPSCSRTGYTLTGYTRTSGSGGTLNTSTGTVTNVSGNQTIRANWSINSYTVTFNGNGGSCTPSSESVNYGSNSSTPSCSRTGYHVTSFSRTAGSGGTLNTSTGQVTSVTGSQTIAPNWQINSYTVTFDGNGGTCTPSSEPINHGSNSSVPSCTREGYHTIGFTRTAGSGGTLNTSTGQVTSVTGNQTIEPSWELSNANPTAPTSLLTEGLTNPTGLTNITPQFSAIYNDPDAGDSAIYYQIEVNTASNFGGTSMWDSGKTTMTATTEGNRSPNITYNGTTLTYNGQTYYWRIRFWDDDDAQGDWSSAANFSMTVPTATHYEIEVNTSIDFTGTVMWDSGKTAMTATTAGQVSPALNYSGTSLIGGVTYYWRIRFWDMVDNLGPWSDPATFKINRQGNSPTDHLTEGLTNPQYIANTTPKFSAIYDDPDTADVASFYEVEVNTSSDFTGTVMWDSGKTAMTATNEGTRSPDITYAGDPLSNNVTYYWRIRFWDSEDVATVWSATPYPTFSLNTTPNAATGLLTEGQTNPIKVYSMTPQFSAIYNDPNTSDQANYYQIEVNTSSDFTGTVMWDSTKTSTTNINQGTRSSDISYAGTALTEGEIYYWRIKFWDLAGSGSPWSSTANFRMSGDPTAASLLTLGVTNPAYVVFDIYFSSVYTDPNNDNSSAYQIEVNTASNFLGTTMWDSSKTATTVTSGNRSSNIYYNGTGLNYDGTTYYVRMRFWDTDDNVSAWTTGQFTDTLKSFRFDGLRMDGIRLD